MKKVLTFALLLTIIALLSLSALAEGTTITVEVPLNPTYSLIIPADATITYNREENRIGSISATFEDFENSYLQVSCSHAPLTSENADTTIPFIVAVSGEDSPVENPINLGTAAGYSSSKDLSVYIKADNWTAAKSGTYSATITFTASVLKLE